MALRPARRGRNLAAMSAITHRRSAALATICRLVVAAKRHGQASISREELELALEDVDVDGLAEPRRETVSSIGRSIAPTGVTLDTRRH